jgi:hypothetical protein
MASLLDHIMTTTANLAVAKDAEGLAVNKPTILLIYVDDVVTE